MLVVVAVVAVSRAGCSQVVPGLVRASSRETPTNAKQGPWNHHRTVVLNLSRYFVLAQPNIQTANLMRI